MVSSCSNASWLGAPPYDVVDGSYPQPAEERQQHREEPEKRNLVEVDVEGIRGRIRRGGRPSRRDKFGGRGATQTPATQHAIAVHHGLVTIHRDGLADPLPGMSAEPLGEQTEVKAVQRQGIAGIKDKDATGVS